LGKLLKKIGGGPLMKKLLMLAAVLAVVLVVAGHKGEGQLNPRRKWLLPMHHDDSSRPSYLLVGLIEKSEWRELLDELYLYALEPTNEFASIG